MSNKLLKITALQPNLKLNEFENNLDSYNNLLNEYSGIIKESQVLCLPEYWNGVRMDKYTTLILEASLDFLRDLAISNSLWVIGGSQIVQEEKSYSNRSHVFSPSGRLIGSYNKRHLFGYERMQDITPGMDDLFWHIDDWKATIKICSDLWNTHDYSLLIKEELDLIFSPILTTIPDRLYTNYGRFMWHNLALIRAKEAAAAVVVSDTAMQPIRDPYWCTGASCIADPSVRFVNAEPLGQGILTSVPKGYSGIVTLTLNLEKIREQKQYRKEMGLLAS
ncbi:MAG: carbon-nitrogen hydrolase family protein [Candidatus Heimdallarchaeota archaeon]|nr:MAG: carbon-nitrogen hydrolase family protein [Candidatus Heimdallarchaeota archaeon]